eukprot:6935841-Prymnesium_polylepis.1
MLWVAELLAAAAREAVAVVIVVPPVGARAAALVSVTVQADAARSRKSATAWTACSRPPSAQQSTETPGMN